VAREEHDRGVEAGVPDPLLETEAVELRHADVEHQAA
jgi:hypothetical protein